MKLQTIVKFEPLGQTIRYGDGLLFVGSCFANEVGNLCKGLGFNALVNPFGELYNPVSVTQALMQMWRNKPFTHDDVIEVGDGQYCTFSHNTAFWRSSDSELLDTVNQSLAEAHKHLEQTRWLIVSLGTSWVYKWKEDGNPVSNCHKLPATLFERQMLTVTQTVASLIDVMYAFSDKHIIFTVSPLRHLKDGAHENQLSKAALFMAVDELCRKFDNAHYFPAYEIMMDELRDYRFYKEDMVHPTEQAVRYIWERFADYAIDPSEKPAMQAAAELRQMLQHKPLFPESEAYKRFETLKQQKIKALRQDFPRIQLANLN